jgi:OOP family OmpA-OmpF porin
MSLPVLVILLSTFASAAWAQVPVAVEGRYIGLSAGGLHRSGSSGGASNPALQAQGLSVRTTAAEDRDTGWKLYAGLRLSRHLAVEGGYVALGRYHSEGQVVQDPGTVQASFKAGGWNLAALGIVPLGGRWEAFGKAGAGYLQARLDAQGRFSGRSSQPADAHAAGPLLGLGASWRHSAAFSARVEWERFGRIGQPDLTGRTDIDLLSIDLQFHF